MAKIMVSCPDSFLEEIDLLAKAEHRSRSELIREALREYMHKSMANKKPINNPQVKNAFEMIRSLKWKGEFDSTKMIREMRDSRYSQ
ncbi:MAG: CopG family transcriptional regulator [Spirochaetota bacterium]|nr:MAG: CopG family transcriptional regulator [Spirochaetota bacterium]